MKNRSIKGLPKDEIPLDDYEWELKEFLDKGKFISMPKKQFEKYKLELQEAARNHITARKSMTIRVNQNDIKAIKIRAQKQGIPYQTFINIVLNQLAQGKIKIAI